MSYLEFTLFVLFVISIYSFFSLAPWVPTKKSDFLRIDKILRLRTGERFLEIGAGTGSLSMHIAKNNPHNMVTGIELSPLFYIISKVRVLFSGLKNIRIIYGNVLKHDISDYDVFYIFGLENTLEKKLIPKLNKEESISARLISYCFPVKNTDYKEIKYKEDKLVLAIYEYKLIHNSKDN